MKRTWQIAFTEWERQPNNQLLGAEGHFRAGWEAHERAQKEWDAQLKQSLTKTVEEWRKGQVGQ